MEPTVGDMNSIEVLVYLEDIIVFGRTLEEHEERFDKVFQTLHEKKLKLSVEKCQFYQTSITYLRHDFSKRSCRRPQEFRSNNLVAKTKNSIVKIFPGALLFFFFPVRMNRIL